MDKELNCLILKAKTGDKKAMSALTEKNERLVWSVVKRFSGRGEETADLFQTGCIGLIKAIKNFDTAKEVCFSTYAVPMIMGEIRRYIRDNGAVKVSRGMKELGVKVRYEADLIAKETGENAAISQIAEKLGVSVEEAASAYAASEPPLSIYRQIGDNLSIMDVLCDKSDFEEKVIDKLFIKSVAEKLDKREKTIVLMRYYYNKTQTQIAEMLGISQVQVSRTEKKILDKMRREAV